VVSEVAKHVVDTKFFIQCKPPEEVAWVDICTATEVHLLIPRVVQDEVDRFKNDGSGRCCSPLQDRTALWRRRKWNQRSELSGLIRIGDGALRLHVIWTEARGLQSILRRPRSMDRWGLKAVVIGRTFGCGAIGQIDRAEVFRGRAIDESFAV
jgi:hypothetical protein